MNLSDESAPLGFQLNIEAGRLVISKVVPGSPGDAAGLVLGDRVEEMGGRPVAALTIAEAGGIVKTARGTTDRLTIVVTSVDRVSADGAAAVSAAVPPVKPRHYPNHCCTRFCCSCCP